MKTSLIIISICFFVTAFFLKNGYTNNVSDQDGVSIESINSQVKSILGLTIKDLSSLFFYSREKYVPQGVIDEYKLDDSFNKLIQLGYLEIVQAKNLPTDISQRTDFFIIKLTKDGKSLIHKLD